MKLQNPTLWLTIALRRSCCTRAALGGIDSWTGSIHGGLPRSKAPLIEDFGSAGLRAVYNFVVQDASQDELDLLFRQSREQGFGLAPVTININGRDTLFATGATALHSQGEVDAEFRTACRKGGGKVYLTHVRYSSDGDQNEQIRVR